MSKGIHPIALKDISNWLAEQNVQIRDEHKDVWVVTPSIMYNKEQKKLNAELGVNRINYYGNTNGKRKSK